MPRHPPIALKTLDRSHCQYPPRDPEGIVASATNPKDCRLSAISKRSSLEPDPVQDLASMALAQKDQLLEIGSRVRLGKPIICGRLSVSRDKSHPLRAMKFEQIFSLRCQTEQAESQEGSPQIFLTNDFCNRFHISTQHPLFPFRTR